MRGRAVSVPLDATPSLPVCWFYILHVSPLQDTVIGADLRSLPCADSFIETRQLSPTVSWSRLQWHYTARAHLIGMERLRIARGGLE